MKQNLKQNLVTGGGKVGTILADYALEFNGTDEYLQIALPNNIASGTANDWVSAGSKPAGWAETGTIVWNVTSEIGTTSTYSVSLYRSGGPSTEITIPGLTAGKKYKLRLRYKGTSCYISYGGAPTTFLSTSEWNAITIIFTAVGTNFYIGSSSGTCYVDYLSIKEDQGFDLNKDQEQILHSRNAMFNNAGTDWVAKDGSSNHTCALSTTDKSEGTGSLLITATGAGDATNHHVLLPSANIESCVSGKKYTLEGFARLDPASLVYANNATLSNDFSSSVGVWGAIRGTVAIESGLLKWTSDSNPNTPRGIYAIGYGVSGKCYRIRFKAKSPDFTTVFFTYMGVIATGNTQTTIKNPNLTTDFQDYEFYTNVLTSGPIYIGGGTNGDFTGKIIYFDDILIDDALAPTITAQLGTKSVTSSALSIVSGTFTKFVLNFEATASEQSQDLKLYLNGAGSVFVDKLSLTQAFDMWVTQKVKHVLGAYVGYSLSMYNTGNGGIQIAKAVDNKLYTYIYDNANAQVTSTGETLDSSYNSMSVLSTNSEHKVYLNGVLKDTDSTLLLGKKTNGGFRIGWALAGGGTRLNGLVAVTQVIRFENIALSTFNSAIVGLQYPTGGGAEEVLRLTFQSGVSTTELVRDYSPKGHTVTMVNMSLDNRCK